MIAARAWHILSSWFYSIDMSHLKTFQWAESGLLPCPTGPLSKLIPFIVISPASSSYPRDHLLYYAWVQSWVSISFLALETWLQKETGVNLSSAIPTPGHMPHAAPHGNIYSSLFRSSFCLLHNNIYSLLHPGLLVDKLTVTAAEGLGLGLGLGLLHTWSQVRLLRSAHPQLTPSTMDTMPPQRHPAFIWWDLVFIFSSLWWTPGFWTRPVFIWGGFYSSTFPLSCSSMHQY